MTRLVDADEVLNAIYQYAREDGYINLHIGTIDTIISNVPTVERPHGEWIKDDWVRDLKGEFHRQYTCSECGYKVIKCYPFCVCGAKMSKEGEQDE